jgi:hypothetical protein
MTTIKITAASDVALYIAARDLQTEAHAALARGESLRVVHAKHPASGVHVETLIVEAAGGASGDTGRAGQCLGGSPATWGDYTEDDHGGYLMHDESAEIFLLDGTLSAEVD